MKAKRRTAYGVTRTGRCCIDCQEFKPWREFYVKKTGIEGHEARCKECTRKKANDRYQNDPEHQEKMKEKQRRAYREKRTIKTKRGHSRGKMVWNDNGRFCTHCKVFRRWEFFSKSKKGVQGHQNICRKCAHEAYLKWLEKPGNRQKKALYQKNYQKKRDDALQEDAIDIL